MKEEMGQNLGSKEEGAEHFATDDIHTLHCSHFHAFSQLL